MQIKLQCKESARYAVRAAFIRDAAPEAWLREISRWELAPHQLECYVLPQSIGNIEAAGLFVIFKEGQLPKTIELLEPYGLLADRLFVPQHSSLQPQPEQEELKKLLHWDWLVFHPVIGLIGFEITDALKLEELLFIELPREKEWHFAHPPQQPRPGLQQIRLAQPSVEEVLDNFRKAIEPKSLDDLPEQKEGKSTPLSRAVDSVKRGLLKGGLTALNSFVEGLSDGQSANSGKEQQASPSSGSTGSADDPGLFQRLENWMLQNLEQLEKKRNEEINRLLHLFDEDSDEALRYALPLNSPYLNRGKAAPSASLSRRSTNFSLGGLGGGGAVDGWDIGNHYYDLRTKYQRAAQKALDEKRYDKAAYVHAHLLGDFLTAARVLEQGKRYYEAAVLYKDHLKNKPAAAECLEKGGLLMEAIDLYEELNKHEKVGDLYKQMGQKEQAGPYYERCIDEVMLNKDYLEASRIMQLKLEQQERARETLLEGWKQSKQAEPCLMRYFDLAPGQKEVDLGREVQAVYERHTPKSKRSSFLNVLVQLNQQHSGEVLQDTSRELAYEIISEEVQEGKLANMSSLKLFLPQDRLIASDCSRFVNQERHQPKKKRAESPFQLDHSIQWFKVVNHRNQYLALGRKGKTLHLARGNWYGNFEYYAWTDAVPEQEIINIIAEPAYSHKVILQTSSGLALEVKELPKNKYFDEALQVGCPAAWLAKDLLGIAIDDRGAIAILKADPASGVLNLLMYNQKGELVKKMDCLFEDDFLVMEQPAVPLELVYREEKYYCFYESWLFEIHPAEEGRVYSLALHSVGSTMTVTELYGDIKIAVGTEAGFQVFRPSTGFLREYKELIIQNFQPRLVKFLSASLLVVADRQEAVLYQITPGSPIEVQRVKTNGLIAGVLATSNRQQFALLEENGRLGLYNIKLPQE